MTDLTEVQVVTKPHAVQEGWITFQVIEVYASLKRDERFAHVKLAPEDGKQVVLAHERHLGAGPKPENTVLSIEIEDVLVELLETLENAIARSVVQQRSKKEDW